MPRSSADSVTEIKIEDIYGHERNVDGDGEMIDDSQRE